jgi:hypothetical protein
MLEALKCDEHQIHKVNKWYFTSFVPNVLSIDISSYDHIQAWIDIALVFGCLEYMGLEFH